MLGYFTLITNVCFGQPRNNMEIPQLHPIREGALVEFRHIRLGFDFFVHRILLLPPISIGIANPYRP